MNLKLVRRKLDRAEREIKQWLAAPPKDAPPQNLSAAHEFLGDIYERSPRKRRRAAEYQTALTINPKNAEAKKALERLK